MNKFFKILFKLKDKPILKTGFCPCSPPGCCNNKNIYNPPHTPCLGKNKKKQNLCPDCIEKCCKHCGTRCWCE